MYSLNLPKCPLKITEKNGKYYVFDLLRRKNVVLTPEEWVRQHFVNYLLTAKNVPKELMANEVAITLNALSRRCDTVIYDTYLKPLAIIEYKAPSVRITQDVVEQIARYNLVLKVHYLIVSNGMEHYCCRIDYDTHSYSHLKAIPSYTELLATE